jgi:predicted RND superfamily exporter protein
MTFIYKFIEKQFSWFASLVYTHKYITLLAVLIFTFALAAEIPTLTIDTRDESFFHDDDPVLVDYNMFRDTFGQDDMFIISLRPKEGISREFLFTLYDLHKELEENLPHVDEVNSLVNARVTLSRDNTLTVEELMEKKPTTEDQYQRILGLIDRYPLYEKIYVSRDRSLVSIIVKARAVIEKEQEDDLAGFDDDVSVSQVQNRETIYLSNEQNIEIYNAIHSITKAYQDKGIEFYYAGTPAFVAEITKGIEKDLGLMMPLSLLIIIVFLYILFRQVTGVIYPLITVLFSLVATLGVMALFGIPITTVIQILPTFLIVVGVGDSVHILTIFYKNLQQIRDKRKAIVSAVGYAGLPVLMTSITTSCGLFSFVWADVKSVSQLGYVAPIGVMLAFIYTVTLLPALIAIFPVKIKPDKTDDKSSRATDLLRKIAMVSTHRPVLICCVSAVIIIVSVYGSLKLQFSHNAMTWFPKDFPIRVSSTLLDEINGGTLMLEWLIDTGEDDGIQDPEFLAALDKAALEIPEIQVHGITASKAISITDVLKEINRSLFDDQESAYVVPKTRDLVAQELFLFESTGSDDLTDVTDPGIQTARLSLLAPFTDSILYKDYVAQIKDYLTPLFPDKEISLTGHIALFIKITKNFVTSMAKSYLIALVLITLLMILMVGRFRVGLLSMVANVVPIIMIFGVMGYLAIPLDMSTILVGSIVLGLVVDDTIHFLHHFRRAYDDADTVQTCPTQAGRVEHAVFETLNTTGRALVITSIVLCGGFFIFTTSFLLCNIRFGILTGSAVIFALVADFFLIPALLALVYGGKRDVSVGG